MNYKAKRVNLRNRILLTVIVAQYITGWRSVVKKIYHVREAREIYSRRLTDNQLYIHRCRKREGRRGRPQKILEGDINSDFILQTLSLYFIVHTSHLIVHTLH